MKKFYSVILAIIVLVPLMGGCQTPPSFLYTPIATNATGQVSYGVNPTIQGAENTAQNLSGFVPDPYGVFVKTGLGIFSGLLAIGLGYYNRKFNSAQTVLQAVSDGVTAVGHDATITAIQNAAAAAGVHDTLPSALANASPVTVATPTKT